MSDLTESRPGNQRLRAISRPAIIVAVFLGLHLLPLLWRPDALWGVDFLVYLPAPVQVAFVLLSILLFIPGFRRQVRACVRRLPLAIWGRRRRIWITRVLILLIALAAFVALSSARHFLGDGYLLLRKLGADTFQDQSRAPLTFAFIRELHHAGRAFWETPENTYRIYSYASGVFYVLLSFPVASALGRNRLEMSVVLAVLLTTGYMQLFFGYVENFALYMPGLLLYLLLGLQTQKSGRHLYAPAIVLGLLLALHQAFAVFGPSLLVLAYSTWRKRQQTVSTSKNTAATVAALCCVPVSTAVLLGLSGIGFEGYLVRMGGRNFLPLFAEPGLHSEYRVFSLAHLLDFSNQQLLAAPVACMACVLLRKRDLRHQPFLFIAAVFPLFFTFLARPEIGVFRDWDIFSLPALPLTLWVATALMARIHAREPLFHSGFILCGSAAFHTLFWIGLNASTGAAEARFVHLAARLTGVSAVNSWLTLGEFHRRQDNIPVAVQAYERSIDADPTNPNRWLTVGNICREIGRSASAVEYYQKAVEIQSNLPVPYMNLGAAYSDIGEFGKAIEYTRKAIALKPDLATAHANLGAIFRKTGQLDEAVEHLEKASELQPREAETHSNLGAAYNDAGQYANAIRALTKAVALRTDDAIAYGNLGAVYAKMGQFNYAIQYLERAVEFRPDYSRAHKNLGLVYKTQGRYQEAIVHFGKVLELQRESVSATVYMDIGDTYCKLREYDKAIPYFKRAVQLNPNHADAHLLLGMSCRALKRGDEARAHFEKTLELEPDHPQAAQIRQWLEQASEQR